MESFLRGEGNGKSRDRGNVQGGTSELGLIGLGKGNKGGGQKGGGPKTVGDFCQLQAERGGVGTCKVRWGIGGGLKSTTNAFTFAGRRLQELQHGRQVQSLKGEA